jgi:predicted ferric reductase
MSPLHHQNKPSRGFQLSGPQAAALFVALTLLPLLAATLSGVEPVDAWTEFGSGLALIAAALVFLQFLSSGRFEGLSGKVGIDRMMGFHRISAVALLIFAALHPLSYVGAELIESPAAAWNHLAEMLAGGRMRSGVVALAMLAFVVASASARSSRLIRYEYWRASHGALAIAVSGLVLHHALTVGSYSAETAVRLAWAALATLAAGAGVLIYLVRPWVMWREDWRVAGVSRIGDGAVRMMLRGPDDTRLDFRAGQFIWMTVAPFQPPFHDHPFSIASSPEDLPELRLIVGEAGDCTSGFAQIEPGRRVAIDGPHGSFVMPEHAQRVIMVAGGVGIAPLLGMLEDAAAKRDTRPFRLLYAARNAGALAGLARLRDLQARLDLTLTCCLDQRCDDPGIDAGPLTRQKIDDLLAGIAPGEVTALICGPAGLMEMAADQLVALGVPARQIHYERFDYVAGRGRLDRRRGRIALVVLLLLFASALAFSQR